VVHRAAELRPQTTLKIIKETDALRNAERFEEFLLACEADARGRLGLESQPYPQAETLRAALRAVRSVDAAQVRADTGLEGEALGRALHDARLKALQDSSAALAAVDEKQHSAVEPGVE
jgi:tRNA nucleotidyltransferase (CCA-adding enzyme)